MKKRGPVELIGARRIWAGKGVFTSQRQRKREDSDETDDETGDEQGGLGGLGKAARLELNRWCYPAYF